MSGRTPTPKEVEAWDRQDEAAVLRRKGLGYKEIAQRLGYASQAGAANAVRSAMQRAAHEAVDEMRLIELDRLDDLMVGLLMTFNHPPPLVDRRGEMVRDDVGRAVEDGAVKIQAGLALLKLSERRAKLVGMDAPTRATVQVITDGMLAQVIREQRPEIERLKEQARVLGIPEHRIKMPDAIEAQAAELVAPE